MTECALCETPLSGGTDTFGWPWDLCWNCYAELNSNVGQTWYGLAPHHHDESITGHMIGSTVFDPLPEKKAEGGYDCGDAIFWPDAGTDNRIGFWMSKTMRGWR